MVAGSTVGKPDHMPVTLVLFLTHEILALPILLHKLKNEEILFLSFCFLNDKQKAANLFKPAGTLM